MKDDALPQNPGMCLPYTCRLSLHAKDVGSCTAISFYAYKSFSKYKAGAPRSIRFGFFETSQ